MFASREVATIEAVSDVGDDGDNKGEVRVLLVHHSSLRVIHAIYIYMLCCLARMITNRMGTISAKLRKNSAYS